MSDFMPSYMRVLQTQEREEKIETEHGIPWYSRGRLSLASLTPVTTADVTGSVLYFTPTELGFFDELSLDINPVTIGDTTLGSPILENIPDTRQLGAGMTITGAGIPALTTISSITDSTTLIMSANATATAASVAITFGIATGELWDMRLDTQNFILSPVQWLNFGAGTSTRNVAVAYDRGIPYLSTQQYKLLGTFRTSAADTIADTITQRFLSNVYNPVHKNLFSCPGYIDNNTSTSYVLPAVGVYASLNGGTGSTIEFVHPFTRDTRSCIHFTGSVGSGSIQIGTAMNSVTSPTYVASQQYPSVLALSDFAGGPFTSPAGYNYFEIVGFANVAATIFADFVRLGATADTPMTYIEAMICL